MRGSITEILSNIHLNKDDIKHRFLHHEQGILYGAALRMKHRADRVQGFFQALVSSDNRFPQDLYAPMFICDAICFVIVIFGYSAFGVSGFVALA